MSRWRPILVSGRLPMSRAGRRDPRARAGRGVGRAARARARRAAARAGQRRRRRPRAGGGGHAGHARRAGGAGGDGLGRAQRDRAAGEPRAAGRRRGRAARRRRALMFLGKVVGTVWSTVKWKQVEGLKLLLVRPYSLADLGGAPARPAPTHEAVVCADVLDAGVGDDVVCAYGHAARVAVAERLPEGEAPPVPIDAAVVAIVDGMDVRAA